MEYYSEKLQCLFLETQQKGVSALRMVISESLVMKA